MLMDFNQHFYAAIFSDNLEHNYNLKTVQVPSGNWFEIGLIFHTTVSLLLIQMNCSSLSKPYYIKIAL